MAKAGIAPVDAYGRHADFHSLRYTFCRLMGEVLPIQKVKVLMRHGTIGLTADLYGKLGIDDLGEDVWNLPPILGAVPAKGALPLAHTRAESVPSRAESVPSRADEDAT